MIIFRLRNLCGRLALVALLLAALALSVAHSLGLVPDGTVAIILAGAATTGWLATSVAHHHERRSSR